MALLSQRKKYAVTIGSLSKDVFDQRKSAGTEA